MLHQMSRLKQDIIKQHNNKSKQNIWKEKYPQTGLLKRGPVQIKFT